MKRILVLAGSPLQVPLIRRAKEMGLYVISMDNLPVNPGHKVSHRYENISTTDVNAALRSAQKNRIDAVMTCGSDVAVPTIGYICDKMKINGVSYKQAVTLTRKDLFRDFQKKNGLLCPEFFVFSSYRKFSECINNLQGEYFIKPVDSSGSKGVRLLNLPVTRSDTGIEAVFCNAIFFSKAKKVILEKYLPGLECGGDAFIVGDKLVSFLVTNKYLSEPPYFVPICHTVPSKLPIAIQQDISKQITKITKIIGLRNGPINFDVMVNKGDVTIIEMSPRIGGNCIPQLVHYSSGFNEIEAGIRLALGMPHDFERNRNKNNLPTGVSILRSRKPGFLRNITPIEIISKKYGKSLKELEYDYLPGAKVEKFTQGNHRIGHFIANAKSMHKLEDLIPRIEKDIKIDVGRSR